MTFNDNVQKLKKEIRLNEAKKNETRKYLVRMIHGSPVRVADFARQNNHERSVSLYSIINVTKRIKLMPIYAVMLLVAVLGGGVSASANGALPGDTLYPVKVNVNEKVRAALTLSDDAKAEYEVRLAERRLEEAEKIAAQGELKEEVKLQIEANFEEHADRVEARIKEFEAKENFAPAADVALKFQTSLEAHEQILVRLAESGAEASSAADIVVEVKTRVKSADESREKNEDKLIFDGATGEARTRIINFLNRLEDAAGVALRDAQQYLDANQKALTEGVKAKATAELRAGVDLQKEGSARLDAEKFREAYTFFQQARQIGESILVVMKVDVEVRKDADTVIQFSNEGFRTRIVAPPAGTLAPQKITDDAVKFEIEEEHGVFFLKADLPEAEERDGSSDDSSRDSSDDVNDLPDDSDGRDDDNSGKGSLERTLDVRL